MKADRSWIVSEVSRSALATIVLGLLVVAPGCRSVRPTPPDTVSTGGTTAGGTGGSGGRGGAGGSGGSENGGSGGNSPPDANPPDLAGDKPPAEVAPNCGGTGQACCPGNECAGGGCCELGTCTPFGNSCRLVTSHSCLSSRCGAECGGYKMRCCPQRNCTEKLTVCDGAPTGVGTCEYCGGMGQPCCTGNYCTGSIMCISGRCGPPTVPDGGIDAPRDAPRDTPADAPRG